MPPKLLFYTHSLVDGGAERLWAGLASHFKRRGYEVIFAQDFASTDNLASLDPAVRLVTLGRGHAGSVLRLSRLLRAEHPAVVLSAVGGSNVKLLAAQLLSFSRARTIISYHGFDEHRSGWLAWAAYAGLPLMSRIAARTVAVSNGLRDALVRRWGARAGRTIALHNPVAFPENLALPTRASLAARPDTILAVGRLVPEKDFVTLIEAFAKLDRANARLVILGKGPEEARVKAEISRLGLTGRVELAGYVSEPWAAYERAKCLAVSSSSESFGNVIVEAMAHGLPVAATACPGPVEILDNGAYGEIVPVGDAEALARALAKLLDDPGDPAPRRARAEQFSFPARVSHYETLVADVWPKAKQRRPGSRRFARAGSTKRARVKVSP